jgi:superfamily I DNA/RNA helicase
MQNDEQEADQVAIMISADRFQRKNKWSDFAILYRGNHQARIIEQALRKERIPYTISGGQSFFDKAEIKDIISYLRLIANEGDDPAFIRAITTPKRGVGMATLEVLGEFSKQWNCSLFEAAFKGGIEAKLPDRQLIPLREFCTFINELEVARQPPRTVRQRRERRRGARRHDERDQLRALPVRQLRRPRRAGQVAERARVHQLAEGTRQRRQGQARAKKRTCSN